MSSGLDMFSNFVIFNRLPPFTPRRDRRDSRNERAKINILRLLAEIDDLEETLRRVAGIEDPEMFQEALFRFGLNDRKLNQDIFETAKRLHATCSRIQGG